MVSINRKVDFIMPGVKKQGEISAASGFGHSAVLGVQSRVKTAAAGAAIAHGTGWRCRAVRRLHRPHKRFSPKPRGGVAATRAIGPQRTLCTAHAYLYDSTVSYSMRRAVSTAASCPARCAGAPPSTPAMRSAQAITRLHSSYSLPHPCPHICLIALARPAASPRSPPRLSRPAALCPLP